MRTWALLTQHWGGLLLVQSAAAEFWVFGTPAFKKCGTRRATISPRSSDFPTLVR